MQLYETVEAATGAYETLKSILVAIDKDIDRCNSLGLSDTVGGLYLARVEVSNARNNAELQAAQIASATARKAGVTP